MLKVPAADGIRPTNPDAGSLPASNTHGREEGIPDKARKTCGGEQVRRGDQRREKAARCGWVLCSMSTRNWTRLQIRLLLTRLVQILSCFFSFPSINFHSLPYGFSFAHGLCHPQPHLLLLAARSRSTGSELVRLRIFPCACVWSIALLHLRAFWSLQSL